MMLNKFIKPEYWYTFQEIIDLEPYDTDNEAGFKSFFDISTIMLNIWFPTGNTDIQLALCQMLLRRYSDHYVIPCSSNDVFSDEYNAMMFRVAQKLTNIYVETKDRYFTLLKAYKDEADNLMNGIKTETTGIGRFNDTPQNVMSGEDEFIDNTHVSNISKQTGETITDADTKIARLDEIRRKYADLMKEWTDEFEDMFIESENIL